MKQIQNIKTAAKKVGMQITKSGLLKIKALFHKTYYCATTDMGKADKTCKKSQKGQREIQIAECNSMQCTTKTLLFI